MVISLLGSFPFTYQTAQKPRCSLLTGCPTSTFVSGLRSEYSNPPLIDSRWVRCEACRAIHQKFSSISLVPKILRWGGHKDEALGNVAGMGRMSTQSTTTIGTLFSIVLWCSNYWGALEATFVYHPAAVMLVGGYPVHDGRLL
jgi:hypothetical protein